MTTTSRPPNVPQWISKTLYLAAAYNVLWGAWVALFPAAFFSVTGIPKPMYPALWQCIGMIVGVFGVGYYIAARDPFRHWPIILVGFLGKVLGPIGFAWAWFRGELPIEFGYTIITNDLIWWIPFFAILYNAARANQLSAPNDGDHSLLESDILRSITTNMGNSLHELSTTQPVMLVLLRHLGCTFCLEAIQQLAQKRQEIDDVNAKLVFVHMGPSDAAEEIFNRFGFNDAEHVTDPDRKLYRLLSLKRGTLGQVFGPRVWLRGLIAAVRTRQIAGKLQGDGFQMPGIAFIRAGKITSIHRHRSAAENPDYVDLAATSCKFDPTTTSKTISSAG